MLGKFIIFLLERMPFLEIAIRRFLWRFPQIKEFIKVTGYLEIHEKYQQYLRETCNKLYDEIGDTIKNQCDYFQIKHLKNAQRKQKIFISKLAPTSKNTQNTNVSNVLVIKKSNAIDLCTKNGFLFSRLIITPQKTALKTYIG